MLKVDNIILLWRVVSFNSFDVVLRLPQAAATTCYVAANPRLSNITGKYFADCNEASPSKIAASLTEAARLWSASEIMVNTNSKLVFNPNNALD